MTTRLPHPFGNEPFTTREALAAGVVKDRLRRQDLTHPFRGVHLHRSIADTLAARCGGLQKRLPLDAFFSSATAALLIGMPLPRRLAAADVVHVTVPAPHTAPTGRRIVGHSVRCSADDWGWWNGLRVSTPERTWCDLAGVLGLAELVAAGDYLLNRRLPLTTEAALLEAVSRRAARRGMRMIERALPLLTDRSESPKESELRVILVSAGLRGVIANHPIRTSGGYRYRADLAFPALKVIVEYQGEYHRDQWRKDMTRRSRLEADGWVVIEVNNDDLADPRELVQRVRRVIALAELRLARGQHA